eukprot:6183286-Pleurochrysis_carterae.AAC.2
MNAFLYPSTHRRRERLSQCRCAPGRNAPRRQRVRQRGGERGAVAVAAAQGGLELDRAVAEREDRVRVSQAVLVPSKRSAHVLELVAKLTNL